MLYTFTPDNPSGRYSLALSHPTHHMVARRLLALSAQQEVSVVSESNFIARVLGSFVEHRLVLGGCWRCQHSKRWVLGLS